MMNASMTIASGPSDAELVAQSREGSREAFGRIVARYQSLVCALAYSATGSLSQSEDLAQETFVAAWKQLAALREPEKLRAWLCSIARNLIRNSLRRLGREPVHGAESLEAAREFPAPEPPPVEKVINREEEAILWRSLEQIPEIYREPLVLFYREHCSVEAVAQALELSKDAVHQRLSRGRKCLQEQVLAFVEGALAKTGPDTAFTTSVVAALPLLAATTQSATAGATAAKGGTAIKLLFMTKTTQAIIVAAATTAVILTSQTVWHHFRSPASRRVQTGLTRFNGALTPRQAVGATQAARGFFEAVANGDWTTVGKYWPPGSLKGVDDLFTPSLKKFAAGMQIVSLGAPYMDRQRPFVIDVPYEVQWKAGGTQTNSLRLSKEHNGQWIWVGGF
jgi:RNA polymerase sigma factor (sigma-70 family)